MRHGKATHSHGCPLDGGGRGHDPIAMVDLDAVYRAVPAARGAWVVCAVWGRGVWRVRAAYSRTVSEVISAPPPPLSFCH